MHLQDVKRKHRTLHNLNWKKIYDSEHNPDIATQDEFAAKLHSALSRLHNTMEITLLHALSTALKESASTHVIQMRFHVLCMTLLPENGHRKPPLLQEFTGGRKFLDTLNTRRMMA